MVKRLFPGTRLFKIWSCVCDDDDDDSDEDDDDDDDDEDVDDQILSQTSKGIFLL